MKKADFKDPFAAGQLIGMLVMITFIEKNPDASEDMYLQIRSTVANNLQEFLGKPAEDINLMIDSIVSEI